MAGISYKKRGVRYDRATQEITRQKLADAGVPDRLMKAFRGEIELTQGQITIGLKVLDKLVPNLQSIEQEVTNATPYAVCPAEYPDAKTWEASVTQPAPDKDTKH
jgi:hypothetical protein